MRLALLVLALALACPLPAGKQPAAVNEAKADGAFAGETFAGEMFAADAAADETNGMAAFADRAVRPAPAAGEGGADAGSERGRHDDVGKTGGGYDGGGFSGSAADEAFASAAAASPAESSAETTDPDFLRVLPFAAALETFAASRREVTGIMAVVDTGVDLDNPRLTPYITEGVNLLVPDKPPQDDNGHGTAVAGVVAAVADALNRRAGGPRWHMKLMPVKALDRKGTGNADRLAQGIRYAVEHGADIVLLSLGLHRDSEELREAVALAERRGVLLVAATGNDAAAFGAKAAVQYPAAYPTVLAVAGAQADRVESRSNAGPEVDVAALWSTRTVALGGGGTVMEGTSIAAPQVAAVAALLRAARPDWTPALVREALRRSAKDIGPRGWDPHTGYGLVQPDRALAGLAQTDRAAGTWLAGADRQSPAVLPVGDERLSVWPEGEHWYTINVPHDGTLTVLLEAAGEWSGKAEIRLTLMPAETERSRNATVRHGALPLRAAFPVSKGTYLLRVEGTSVPAGAPATSSEKAGGKSAAPSGAPSGDPASGHASGKDGNAGTKPSAKEAAGGQAEGERASGGSTGGSSDARKPDTVPAGSQHRALGAGTPLYRVETRLALTPDPYEPNESPLAAHRLSAKNHLQWTGTFHQRGDEDWFVLELPRDGMLRLEIETDTTRIDPAVTLQRIGGDIRQADEAGEGETEEIRVLLAEAGTWYIRIRNAIAARPEAVLGTYRVTLEYITVYDDPNEPNDGPLTATPLGSGKATTGLIDRTGDEDWYRFILDEPSYAELTLADLPRDARVKAELADRRLNPLETWDSKRNLTEGTFGRRLDPGTYYVRITSDAAFRYRYYSLELRTDMLSSGFRDIRGHWAERAIAAVAREGWMNGYRDATFRPDRTLTRAEAVATLVRAFPPENGTPSAMSRLAELLEGHWAYAQILAADRAGWLSLLPGTGLQPERPLQRAEAAALVVRATGIAPRQWKPTFADVPRGHWAAEYIEATVAAGWMRGYPDGRFRPDEPITRAEWAVLLSAGAEGRKT